MPLSSRYLSQKDAIVAIVVMDDRGFMMKILLGSSKLVLGGMILRYYKVIVAIVLT